MAFRPRSVAIKAKKSSSSSVAAARQPNSSSTAPPPASRLEDETGGQEASTRASESVNKASNGLAAIKLDPTEEQRLERLLTTIESCFGDWGLSVHRESGLLELLKQSKDGYVHLQHVLQLHPVRALTGVQADLQKALRLRSSTVLTLHDSGFQVRRKVAPDFACLEHLEPADWDDMSLYLESIPSLPSATSSLSQFLSTLLSTQIQRLILPPPYDPSNRPQETSEPGDAENDQAAAFARSQAESNNAATTDGKRKGLGLPTGGGPFRGFAFVVVSSKDDAERILTAWPWEVREATTQASQAADGEDAIMTNDESDETVKLGKKNGMRAMSYSRWLELKQEYLDYQRHLYALADDSRNARNQDRDRRRQTNRRSPSPPRPEHVRSFSNSNGEVEQDDESISKRSKRPSDAGELSSARPVKRSKRASSPSDWTRQVRSPSPDVPRDGPAAIEAKGAYPTGCILWVRNVHEKSSKTSLKTVFANVLEELEEGSGTGIEFVDYEKGLEICHLRFSSAHLASLVLEYLSSQTCTHLSPTYLSTPEPTSTPPEGIEYDPSRRPIKAELLQGERERLYWQGLPEATRRGARKSAGGGPVGVVKKGKKELAREVVEARTGAAGPDDGGPDLAGTAQSEVEPVQPGMKPEEETPTRRTKKPLKIKFT